ncbi:MULTISPECIES: DEAD/DEAH box helicase family protein [Mycolicibacterium]|uniref:DEAD/DEAH box helicase family protein n=1 Tax=Mycolicibacterium TaxID=1866885 RepID=UPI0009E64790|nr:MULTISPECIES: DEAD/DEAH box helicase family protein [Mycolicibacterium]
MLTLRDYQRAAVDAVTPDEHRALLVSGCGTGKTLMAVHAVAKLLAGAPGTVLLTFPTLGLLEQTYQVWRGEAPMPFSALAVCSQQISDPEDIADDELSIPSTTSAEQLAHWLADTAGVRVVFATYQSAAVLVEAHRAFSAAAWTVMVCDFSSRANAVRHVRQHGEMRLCHTPRRYCSRHPMRVTESGRVKGGGCTRERWSTSSRPRTTRTIRRASRYSTPAPPRSMLAATAG